MTGASRQCVRRKASLPSDSDYRAKAAQYQSVSGRTADFATARRYLARARSYTQLAEIEERLAANPGAHFSKSATSKTTADETAASEGGRSTAGATDRAHVNSNTEEVTPMTTSNQPNQGAQQQNQGGQQGGQQQGGQDQKSGQQTQNPGQGGQQQGDQQPSQPSQPQK
jgi:hypothetical protein